ncbi:hypothetical protein IT415_02940 [bacterium]|nr:hypothetical protein [bacterium]
MKSTNPQQPSDIGILEGLGFKQNQAAAYLLALDIGEITPALLTEKLGETRTNAYSILARLEQLNLITKSKMGKRLSYLPANPIQIEMLAEKRRNILLNNEYRFKSLLPTLTQRYHQLTEQPAVRQYQGIEGLKDIYDDILQTKADVMLIISPNQHDFLGSEYLDGFVATRIRMGIKVQALTPQGFTLPRTLAKHKAHLIEHTFYDSDRYSMPVEINIYADKVAYLSYGQEVFGTVIHSQQIADSMRQLFQILRAEMQSAPDSALSEKRV